MSDSIEEKKRNSSDDEPEIWKSSNTKETDNKELSESNEESKAEELKSEDKSKVGESSREIEIRNKETSEADSEVTTSEDSKAPVSVCFKETNEIYSKENHDLMIKDVHNFFLNLKELQSKRSSIETSKRKLELAGKDCGERSALSHSEESFPSKKLLLDVSTTEGISFQQSQTLPSNAEPCRPSAEDSKTSGSLLADVASEVIHHQEPGEIGNSTDEDSSPQAGTSSENSSTVDQPERTRNEDTTQSATPNPPAEPMVIEYYDQHLNGVTSHNYPGTTDVQIIVPIFQCFLNDLLELRSFLDGRQASSVVPVGAGAGTSSEVPHLDEQLASIADEFGTGVESKIALLTRGAVSEWDRRDLSGVDSERLSVYSEHSEDSSLSGGFDHPTETESNSNETPESSASPDPIVSSASKTAETRTNYSHSNPEIGQLSSLETEDESSTAVNPVQCTELSSAKTKKLIPTHSPRFPAELDHLNLPSEISPLLLVLNVEGRKLVNSCIETSKNFLRICLLHGMNSLQGMLLEHIVKTLDTMRRLISLREDCSDLLKKCPNKNSSARVTYILKVKYYVSKVYNQLLEDILAKSGNFKEVVKDRLPLDSVD